MNNLTKKEKSEEDEIEEIINLDPMNIF